IVFKAHLRRLRTTALRPCLVARSSAERAGLAPVWRHFGDITSVPLFDFAYLALNVHDHLTWTEEIHSTHISSVSQDSNTGGSPDFYEAMTTLAYLAGLVRSVRLGVACLVVVPCRNPLLTAKQIASLDVFCNGRLDIGLGIGSPSTLKSREYEVLRVNRKLRGKIADDYIRAHENDMDESALDL